MNLPVRPAASCINLRTILQARPLESTILFDVPLAKSGAWEIGTVATRQLLLRSANAFGLSTVKIARIDTIKLFGHVGAPNTTITIGQEVVR